MPLILHRWYEIMNIRKLKQNVVNSKQIINVKVTIQDSEVYEVESCWSQETEVFCERVASLVKKFIEQMTCRPEVKF